MSSSSRSRSGRSWSSDASRATAKRNNRADCLTSREAAVKGGDRGPAFVPGKPAESNLIQFVEYAGKLKMPPTGKLPDGEIARLKEWVSRGAVWPETVTTAKNPEGKFSDEQRRWWAFQPVRSVTLPDVKNTTWPRNDIDKFILAELEKRSFAPARAAERACCSAEPRSI